MDAKALAKSKRAHSLHHSKKPHSLHQKQKAQSAGANEGGSGNMALGKQAKEKSRQSVLPSNWDRYEEEFDSRSEDPPGNAVNKHSDIILPKSKGADFRHLMAEAQSQSLSNSYLDTFPSLHDIVSGDFELGVASMLSVRGEGILSWIGDDNFIVEDETAAIPEASFLSLNLNALAEQLAKVDISERLFIETDLLPQELTGDESKTSSSLESDKLQTSKTEATAIVSEELAFRDISKKNKIADQNADVILSGSTLNDPSKSIPFNQRFDMLNQAKGDLDSSQDSKSHKNRESPTKFSVNSVADTKKEVSTFEAATAEAELDMLLDSLSEAKLLDSSDFTSGTFPVSQKEAPLFPPQQTSRSLESSTKFNVGSVVEPKKEVTAFQAASAEAELDMLLDSFSETKSFDSSGFVSDTFPGSQKETPLALLHLTRNTQSSSKETGIAAGLDDILEETSNLSSQNSLYQLGKATAAPSKIQYSSHQFATKSKVLNDFDSWLDTI